MNTGKPCNRFFLLTFILCAGAFPAGVQGAPVLNPVFGSRAVLQSGIPVPVWGKAAPGNEVTVSFAGRTATAVADAAGRWKAVLPPLSVSAEPQKMTVKDASGETVLDDLLVGEVWLVCGRSNIGFSAGRMRNASNEIAGANQPLLRMMSVAEKDPAAEPKDEFSTKGWVAASPSTVAGYSAVGWIFGSELQKARQVPVGIVVSTWGGSRPSMWIEQGYYEANKPGAVKVQSAEQQKFEKESQSYHKATDGQSAQKVGSGPGACFNSHIHPLIPMAMKGTVIFFDGGAPEEIEMLAGNWRQLWGQGDFPYIYIQVHRQGGPVEEDPNMKDDSSRSAYIGLLKKVPGSAMVVALDTGVDGAKDIHPPNKRPVGERVSLAARALAYGETIVYSGPVFSEAVFEGGKAVVSFDHTGSGLEFRGDSLEGFAVSADGRTWVWGRAAIEDGKVVVTADGIKDIKAVRYAFAPNNPKGNLYNKEGLPASPFSSLLPSGK